MLFHPQFANVVFDIGKTPPWAQACGSSIPRLWAVVPERKCQGACNQNRFQITKFPALNMLKHICFGKPVNTQFACTMIQKMLEEKKCMRFQIWLLSIQSYRHTATLYNVHYTFWRSVRMEILAVCSRRFLSNVCHSIHNFYIISQQILQMLTTATNSFQKCKCLNCRFAVLEAFFSACYGYCLQGTWLSGKLQYSPGSLQA